MTLEKMLERFELRAEWELWIPTPLLPGETRAEEVALWSSLQLLNVVL